MKKLFIYLIILIFCPIMSLFAQIPSEVEAKSDLLAAERAYGNSNYTLAIVHIDDAVRLLGATTPRLQYLKAKSLSYLGRYEDVRAALDAYFAIPDIAKVDTEKYPEMVRLIAETKEKIRRKADDKVTADREAIQRIAEDSARAIRNVKRDADDQPLKQWGGFTWGVYLRGGLGVPSHGEVKTASRTPFQKWCNEDAFSIGAGGSLEVGTATLFKISDDSPVRLGFDWTIFHVSTFSQGGSFVYNDPSGKAVPVKTLPISLLGTHIGPAIGFRFAKGATLRVAYQLAPEVMLGGYSSEHNKTFDNISGFYKAGMTQTQSNMTLFQAFSATIKYYPLTLTAKYLTGQTNAKYRLNVEDSSIFTAHTYTEEVNSAFTVNQLMIALGLSF